MSDLNMNKTNWKVNLKELCEEKGITPYRLSVLTGISQKTLYSINSRDLKLSTIILICKELDVTICQLISFN